MTIRFNLTDFMLMCCYIIFFVIIVWGIITLYEANITRDSEKIERFEEFKTKTCVEKQSYLLDNDYTQKERDYYLIECGTIPIGDWEK